MKKVLSTILSCAMCLVLSTPAMAICEAPAETTNAVPVFSSTSAVNLFARISRCVHSSERNYGDVNIAFDYSDGLRYCLC